MAISQEIKQNLLKRLRRIEGQTRGLQRMVEENTYCVDIMNQIAGVQAALEAYGNKLTIFYQGECYQKPLDPCSPD